MSYNHEEFLKTVKEGINYRMESNKNDAYFDIPEMMTSKQLTVVLKKINDFEIDRILARQYTKTRIQVSWDGCPRSSPSEFLHKCGI